MFCLAVGLNRMSSGEMQCRLGYARADPDDHPWQFPAISQALRHLLLWALPSPRKIILLILDDEIEICALMGLCW